MCICFQASAGCTSGTQSILTRNYPYCPSFQQQCQGTREHDSSVLINLASLSHVFNMFAALILAHLEGSPEPASTVVINLFSLSHVCTVFAAPTWSHMKCSPEPASTVLINRISPGQLSVTKNMARKWAHLMGSQEHACIEFVQLPFPCQSSIKSTVLTWHTGKALQSAFGILNPLHILPSLRTEGPCQISSAMSRLNDESDEFFGSSENSPWKDPSLEGPSRLSSAVIFITSHVPKQERNPLPSKSRQS